ncbi:MAG: hypothetical protein RIB30_04295 [Thalassospira sp.]|uniref:hypothetical protein n=1 Tax=Thalassospira sp. TaxID=1912094 RepID=UPI0032EDEF39
MPIRCYRLKDEFCNPDSIRKIMSELKELGITPEIARETDGGEPDIYSITASTKEDLARIVLFFDKCLCH